MNDFNIQFLIFAGPEENVAAVRFGSKPISGEMRSALLDDEHSSYDMEKGNILYIYKIIV